MSYPCPVRSVVGLLLLLPLLLTAAPADRPLLHGLFTDNMILQRDVPCPVWGWTAPGATVTLTFAGQTKSAVAGPDGKWLVRLDAMPASAEPRELVLQVKPPADTRIPPPETRNPKPETSSATLHNIVVGDIWLCSGQSNMEFGIGGVDQWWNELPHGPQPLIRLYWVKPNSTPETARNVTGHWVVCDDDQLLHMKQPLTTVSFTAIGYLFGREVQKHTGVPVGIIESDQGNTAIQSWSTVASLRKIPRYGEVAPWAAYEKEIEEGFQKSDPHYADTLPWRTVDFADVAWPLMDLPVVFSKSELKGFDGLVWFRRTVELPADWAGQPLELQFSAVYGSETTWFNGRFVGGQDGKWQDHRFTVPGDWVKAGKNTIAMRVFDSHGFTGTAEEMQLWRADGKGEPLSLAGPWRWQRGTVMAELTGRKKQQPRIWMPGGLYHGMIAALAPFSIKGVTWYQGEGNAGCSGTYYDELKNLIADWRATFTVGEFPFYLVQLANFGPLPAQPAGSGWATVREAQARVAREVPNCGMAVAIDRGEIGNIHPPNKRDVAERLAKAALAKTYGLKVPYEGPTYLDMKVEGGKVSLNFEHAAGLKSLGAAPVGFALAGADQKFVWAQAWLDGETVVVSAPEVKDPVAVRYGWGDNAVCNLYNKDDLPMVPFRTDAW